jgi:hypothetical protein
VAIYEKTLFGFLMVGLAFIALQVETAEAQIRSDHPCYDIDPANGGRDGHPCWPKGEDPSVSVEASGDLGDGGAGALVGGGPSFDDTLAGTPGMSGAAITGSDSVFGSISKADALGNYGCGNPDKKTHVNCLRGLLSRTPHGTAVKQSSPSNDGLGNYGCGNHDKSTHVNCLRGLLDQHGAYLQVDKPAADAALGTDSPPGYELQLNEHHPGGTAHCDESHTNEAREACIAAAVGGHP